MRALAIVSSICLVLCLGTPAVAQDDASLSDLSLEDLINLELSIASKKGTSARESPGIVTLVTGEEIRNSGARDLIDVLRLVPGFDFAVDVQGVAGLGIRGAWGHEGKILLLVDGQEMNEPLYSTLQFGNRFPVSQIKRIEIIRGPGSVVYGGFAELAVINVITKGAEEIDGFEATLTNGEMSDANARRRIDLSWAGSGGAGSFVLHGSLAEGNRSDRVFTDFLGDSYDMADNSALDDSYLNLSAAWRNYKGRVIVDRYHMTERDEFGENLPEATRLDFDSVFVDATAVYTLAPGLSLTPRIAWKTQTPWKESNDSYVYDKSVDRALANLTASWDPRDGVTVLGGFEYVRDEAKVHGVTSSDDLFPNGRDSISYDNIAVFGQGMFRTPIGRLTIGARWENHSEFGSSFVPRIALTSVRGRFHYKLLASQAFRAPGIENIRLSESIEPEETTVYEVEAGYQLSSDLFVTANVFDINIDKPIVYFYDSETDSEGYANFDKTGTRGFEIETRYRKHWGYVTLGYSRYAASDNRIEAYSVPGNDNALLAMPQDKVAINASFRMGQHARLSPTLAWYGSRYGYGSVDDEGTQQIEKFDSTALASLYFLWDGFLTEQLSVGLGVFDAFGEDFDFIQPYDSYHAPYPDTTREWVIRLAWRSK